MTDLGKRVYWYLQNFFKKRKHLSKMKIMLEVHAAEHCNLNCSGCSHYSPLAEPSFCDTDRLETSLKKLHYFQDIVERFHILGGEPLLNSRLAEIIDLVGKYMDKVPVRIITNGVLLLQPDKLPDGFWEACRRNKVLISVSRYPISLDYDRMAEVCRQQGVDFDIFADRTDKTSHLAWYQWRLNEKGSGCIEYKVRPLKIVRCYRRCLQIVGNRLYPCAQSAYVHHLNKKYGTDFKIKKDDYLEIDKLKDKQQLRRLFLNAVPFCQYCPKTKTITDWKPSRFSREEWVEQ